MDAKKEPATAVAPTLAITAATTTTPKPTPTAAPATETRKRKAPSESAESTKPAKKTKPSSSNDEPAKIAALQETLAANQAKAQRAYSRIESFYAAEPAARTQHSVPKGAITRDEVLRAYQLRMAQLDRGEMPDGENVDSDSEAEFQKAMKLAREAKEQKEKARRDRMAWRETGYLGDAKREAE